MKNIVPKNRLDKFLSIKRLYYGKESESASPEEYLSMLLENTQEAICVVQDERYKFVNTMAQKLVGYSSSEFENKHIKDTTHPDDQEKIVEKFRKRLRGEAIKKYPLKIVDRMGNLKWVEITGIAILWEGEPATLTFISEITKRVEAQEALKRSERQLSDIINFLPDATFVINTKGKIITWNKAIETLTGLCASDMIGKGNFEYALPFYGTRKPMLLDTIRLPEKDIEDIYSSFKKERDLLYAEKSVFIMGEKRRMWCIARGMVDHSGNAVGFIESMRDITRLHDAMITLDNKSVSLERTNVALEEANTTLKVLLEHREKDKYEFEETIVNNVKKLILPYIKDLKLAKLNSREAGFLDTVERNLIEIISPFLKNMKTKYANLTPREIQIASLVKEGKRTKEIAEILTLSPNTIINYRKMLRKKMELKKKSNNLRSYLISIS